MGQYRPATKVQTNGRSRNEKDAPRYPQIDPPLDAAELEAADEAAHAVGLWLFDRRMR